MTDKTRHKIDGGTYGCGIFVDFKKTFDTVDHHILLKKLEYYGIREISNKWFASYLSIWVSQFVSLNGSNSNIVAVKCRVPQGSILKPLSFFIYIHVLHVAIKYSEVTNFADDTNLLYYDICVKSIDKLLNYDLKNLLHWLKAN